MTLVTCWLLWLVEYVKAELPPKSSWRGPISQEAGGGEEEGFGGGGGGTIPEATLSSQE